MVQKVLTRMGRVLLALLYGAGGLSGIFLLLCALGVLSPQVVADALGLEVLESPPGQAVLAPAQVEVRDNPPPEALRPLALESLEDALPGEAVLLDMKPPDGQLGYISALPLAADCGASSGAAERNQALYRLTHRAGGYTAALVSCLRDDALSGYAPGYALRRVSGSVWRDPEGIGWLDPASEEVREYLRGVCLELAALGFDEVILTDCAYPTAGALESLRPCEDRSEALEAFCRQLEEALAEYPEVKLSVVGCGDYGEAESLSGQTAGVLASFPGRVWAEDPEALAAFGAAELPKFD